MPLTIFRRLAALAILATTLVLPAGAWALMFDQNVTSDVIFGSGNANGGFTTDTNGTVELGLRAKLRFDAGNSPQNIFNSNGDGTYSFAATLPPTGFGFAPGSPSTAIWNFEWSINTDKSATPTLFLDDLTYQIQIDFDPGLATNFLSFDPINTLAPVPDHAIGDNTTGNGAGTNAAGVLADYLNLIANNNLAQNSWNMEFFDNAGAGFPFLGSADGQYEIVLSAFSGATQVASTQISVISGAGAPPVPEPSAAILYGVGLCLVGASSRRRRK